jgi:hypothetical protein
MSTEPKFVKEGRKVIEEFLSKNAPVRRDAQVSARPISYKGSFGGEAGNHEARTVAELAKEVRPGDD